MEIIEQKPRDDRQAKLALEIYDAEGEVVERRYLCDVRADADIAIDVEEEESSCTHAGELLKFGHRRATKIRISEDFDGGNVRVAGTV